jgi:hypothetical protein
VPFGPNSLFFSSLKNGPALKEVETATFGCGAVISFEENGEIYTIMGQAGEHYADENGHLKKTYSIFGGFGNLTETEGSSLVKPDKTKPESGRVATAREIEEEFRDDKGNPILNIDPARLKPIDTDTIAFPSGEKRVVISFVFEPTNTELQKIKNHLERLENDDVYRQAVAARTNNPETGKPEVSTVTALKLSDIIDGTEPLLHPDQMSLFKILDQQHRAYQPILYESVPNDATPD